MGQIKNIKLHIVTDIKGSNKQLPPQQQQQQQQQRWLCLSSASAPASTTSPHSSPQPQENTPTLQPAWRSRSAHQRNRTTPGTTCSRLMCRRCPGHSVSF